MRVCDCVSVAIGLAFPLGVIDGVAICGDDGQRLEQRDGVAVDLVDGDGLGHTFAHSLGNADALEVELGERVALADGSLYNGHGLDDDVAHEIVFRLPVHVSTELTDCNCVDDNVALRLALADDVRLTHSDGIHVSVVDDIDEWCRDSELVRLADDEQLRERVSVPDRLDLANAELIVIRASDSQFVIFRYVVCFTLFDRERLHNVNRDRLADVERLRVCLSERLWDDVRDAHAVHVRAPVAELFIHGLAVCVCVLDLERFQNVIRDRFVDC